MQHIALPVFLKVICYKTTVVSANAPAQIVQRVRLMAPAKLALPVITFQTDNAMPVLEIARHALLRQIVHLVSEPHIMIL